MAEQSTYPTAPGEIKYPELPGDVPPSYEATMAGGAGKKFQIYVYLYCIWSLCSKRHLVILYLNTII